MPTIHTIKSPQVKPAKAQIEYYYNGEISRGVVEVSFDGIIVNDVSGWEIVGRKYAILLQRNDDKVQIAHVMWYYLLQTALDAPFSDRIVDGAVVYGPNNEEIAKVNFVEWVDGWYFDASGYVNVELIGPYKSKVAARLEFLCSLFGAILPRYKIHEVVGKLIFV